MIPLLVRFESPSHKHGLYLDARDISSISAAKSDDGDTGTYIVTYRGAIWLVAGTPSEAAAKIAEARRNDAMGLDTVTGDDE